MRDYYGKQIKVCGGWFVQRLINKWQLYYTDWRIRLATVNIPTKIFVGWGLLKQRRSHCFSISQVRWCWYCVKLYYCIRVKVMHGVGERRFAGLTSVVTQLCNTYWRIIEGRSTVADGSSNDMIHCPVAKRLTSSTGDLQLVVPLLISREFLLWVCFGPLSCRIKLDRLWLVATAFDDSAVRRPMSWQYGLVDSLSNRRISEATLYALIICSGHHWSCTSINEMQQLKRWKNWEHVDCRRFQRCREALKLGYCRERRLRLCGTNILIRSHRSESHGFWTSGWNHVSRPNGSRSHHWEKTRSTEDLVWKGINDGINPFYGTNCRIRNPSPRIHGAIIKLRT